MRKKFCAFILRMFGWSAALKVDIPQKCVLCVAPHTSNWDLILGELMYSAIGGVGKVNFLIKKEWLRFPFNLVIAPMGGVAVDRSKKTSLVDQISAEFSKRDSLRVAITPEGTRKANANWRRGFYYIAQQAQVPILLTYFDYKKKVAGIERIFEPSGDVEKDMREIKEYFSQFSGKYPENFAI